MKEFCRHCGRNLNDDDLKCPECGTVTNVGLMKGTPAKPLENGNNNDKMMAMVICAVLVLAGIFIIAPILGGQTSSTYSVEVSVDSISVNDSTGNLHTYDDNAKVYLEFGYAPSTNSEIKNIVIPGTIKWNCKTDGTVVTDLSNNKLNFTITGTESNFVFQLFFRAFIDGGMPEIIDVYDDRENVIKGSATPDTFGVSGVMFNVSDLDEEGKITLTGDTDPIGSVTLKIKITKN